MRPIESAWNGLVRTGFRLLYEEMSWTYDAVSHVVSLGQWQEWRRACLPFLLGPQVLELGFGPGHLQLDLAQQGYRPTGLDASAQMAGAAARRLRDAGESPMLVRGLAQHLPFPAWCFNSVVATFPTPYIASASTLSEVRRVLMPSGRLVIVPEAQLSGGGPLRQLIDAAYRVTGQRQAPDAEPKVRWADVLCAQISAGGLDCAVHHVALSDSQVTIVVGHMPGTA